MGPTMRGGSEYVAMLVDGIKVMGTRYRAWGWNRRGYKNRPNRKGFRIVIRRTRGRESEQIQNNDREDRGMGD